MTHLLSPPQLVLLILAASRCSAWTPPSYPRATHSEARRSVPSVPPADRREFLTRLVVAPAASAAAAGALPWLVGPAPASAAAPSQEAKDKENIVKGYARLQYLLDNWEEETTVCKTGQETTFGDRCERTPVKVMEYLGFKSTNDPLFKAESTMRRLQSSVPSDREGDFYEAVDAFSQNAEEANSMAFVSSWGEANPGGGKDRVRQFIERSKNNVIASRDSLRTVMDILDLKP